MIFQGISRIFSTRDSMQFETIGVFWKELSAKYGIENLRGLGYNWTESTIEYVIGLKEDVIDGANCTVELPDEGWKEVCGKTNALGEIYDKIYKDGNLKYEIEMFSESGDCVIQYFR